VRLLVVLVLVGCGRINFGDHSDGGVADAPDGPRLPFDIRPLDASLPSGLVVWFPLDDIDATNAADVVSGVNGTCSGSTCPTMTTGHHGTAFDFDGTDDCITVPDMGQFGQATLTLSLWVRHDLLDGSSMIAKPVDPGGGNLANSWQLQTTNTNQAMFTTTHIGSSTNTNIGTPADTLPLATFHHVAATWDGAVKRLYTDGVEGAIQPQGNGLLYGTFVMLIGCDENNTGPALRFNGVIDDVQIYNRALTAAEIQVLAAM
jgi:hypothetical protein